MGHSRWPGSVWVCQLATMGCLTCFLDSQECLFLRCCELLEFLFVGFWVLSLQVVSSHFVVGKLIFSGQCICNRKDRKYNSKHLKNPVNNQNISSVGAENCMSHSISVKMKMPYIIYYDHEKYPLSLPKLGCLSLLVYMKQLTVHDGATTSDTTMENMTMGKVNTYDLMMMIMRWVTDISSRPLKLEWINWIHTTPFIACMYYMFKCLTYSTSCRDWCMIFTWFFVGEKKSFLIQMDKACCTLL